ANRRHGWAASLRIQHIHAAAQRIDRHPFQQIPGWREFNNDGEWQLRVEPAQKEVAGSVQISSRRWRFITRQIDGNYPNWRQVVPQPGDFKTTVQLSPATTESVIRLIPKIPCSDKVNHTIAINIVNHKL